MTGENQEFELKDEHVKILSQVYISDENGVPSVDRKRPFGNKDFESDILEILGEEKIGDDSCWSSSQRKRANHLYRELIIAIQVVLNCKTFEPGLYYRKNTYDHRSWTRKS